MDELDVDNVYIYVADAVRWDYTPDALLKKGLSVKTIAASVHTPNSFASIVSGTYLPQHGVGAFKDQISADVPHLLHTDEVATAFANTLGDQFSKERSESIIDKTLNIEKSLPDTLGDIESPFVFLERGPGGHSPYGDYTGNAKEYYVERGATDKEQYRTEYRESVSEDVTWFESQVNRLEERGLLDDTLIIYTSDHGEILGEDGRLGHYGPPHPSLSYVPTVFIHPTIEDTNITGQVFRHVDIEPTVRSVLDGRRESAMQPVGVDVTKHGFQSRGATFFDTGQQIPFFDDASHLRYESLWDYDGGVGFAKSNVTDRLFHLMAKLKGATTAEFRRAHALDNCKEYLKTDFQYGNPQFDSEQALQELDEINQNRGSAAGKVENVNQQRLRDLGYLK